MSAPRIALVGEDRGHPSHLELRALIPRLRAELGAEASWVGTSSKPSAAAWDGVWLVPGSPYADDAAADAVISSAREAGVPFLGTCGGFQYATLNYLRHVLGRSASHAESDGVREDNAVVELACSLRGEEREVVPVRGSWFERLCPEPFVGMHYCGFAPSPATIETIVAAGGSVGATAEDAGVEALRFPGEVFAVGTLFQPHIGAAAGLPLHPLVVAFVEAARARAGLRG
ncbi:MAG: hypothetical protein LBE25_15895 [Arthrobacter sp.]|jgi:CTP synthase (UTP-ammonia lyase)|nr:hypothetical protein [Arthrobacter sp.]